MKWFIAILFIMVITKYLLIALKRALQEAKYVALYTTSGMERIV
ncbi:hypothetical protein [Peribacillus simplex]|nr:hypothetical protein [Peribacillus simplex]